MTHAPSLALSLALAALAVGSDGAHAADEAMIARGKYLFDAADCGGCHGGDQNGAAPAGGLGLDTPFGIFYVPNITPDKEHGIGRWSEADFHRALRDGIARNGDRLFPVFPFTSFTNMSDSDMADLYAYLMTREPVPQPNKPHQVSPPFGWRSLLVFWRTLFFKPGPITIEAAKGEDWNRGNYLVHAVAHCEECHTPRNVMGALKPSMGFSGNIGGPDGMNAPNITSDSETGIGDWSVVDIERVLKTGMTPDSDMLGSGMKAVVRGTSKLTDADRHAIAVYLKSVPPIHVAPQPPPPIKPTS
jgi:mono/diheme cytochrome c family protein